MRHRARWAVLSFCLLGSAIPQSAAHSADDRYAIHMPWSVWFLAFGLSRVGHDRWPERSHSGNNASAHVRLLALAWPMEPM